MRDFESEGLNIVKNFERILKLFENFLRNKYKKSGVDVIGVWVVKKGFDNGGKYELNSDPSGEQFAILKITYKFNKIISGDFYEIYYETFKKVENDKDIQDLLNDKDINVGQWAAL